MPFPIVVGLRSPALSSSPGSEAVFWDIPVSWDTWSFFETWESLPFICAVSLPCQAVL